MDYNIFNRDFVHKKRISSHKECINTLEISPSGHFLASAGDDKTLLFTHILSENFSSKEFISTPHEANIQFLKYKDEFNIYTCGMDGLICVYDLNSSICLRAFRTSNPCFKVSLDRWSSLIGVSTSKHIVFYDERKSFKPIFKVELHNAKMEFRPETEEFIVCSMNNYMQLYDFKNMNKPLRTYSIDHEFSGISDCTFNSDGTQILVTPHGGGPEIYSVEKMVKIAECAIEDPPNFVTYKSFKFGGPLDSYVLGGFDDKTLKYWKLNPSTGEDIEDFPFKKLLEPKNRQNSSVIPRSRVELVRRNSSDISAVIKKITKKYSSRKIIIDNQKTLTGFNSIINTAVMHKSMPLIFGAGVENCIYAFSPFDLGEDDNIELNYDSIAVLESYIDEVYRHNT